MGEHFSSLQQIFLASEKEEGANKKESNKKEKKNEDYLERKVRPVELLTGLRCNEGHLCSDKLMHVRYTNVINNKFWHAGGFGDKKCINTIHNNQQKANIASWGPKCWHVQDPTPTPLLEIPRF